MEKMTLFDTLIVVKRSGQRTTFQGEKIAIAIKKAFDSVENNYKEEDANKVYEAVLKTIEKEYIDRKTIQIEDIQDLIEMTLQKKNYQDVFLSFKTYREHRNASRKSFITKQQHKFLKTIETLGFNKEEENALLKRKSPSQLLENYGTTIASGFTKSYLLDTKIVRAIDSGLIGISHLESIALGSIESIELDVSRLFKEKILLTTKQDYLVQNIDDFFDSLLLLIKSCAHSVYGQIQISNLDYDIVPYILTTYKECLQEEINDFLEFSGFKMFLSGDRIKKEIDRLGSIKENITLLDELCSQEELLEISFKRAIQLAKEKTNKRIHKSLTRFLINLNSIYDKLENFPKISIGMGTATQEEAKIFMQILLEIAKQEDYLEPTYVFKLKKGKNIEENDPNYHLLESYLHLAIKSKKFLFANLEAKQNRKYYEEGVPNSEICYFSDGSRVVEDSTIQDARIMGGKGNLFTCSINLPRLGFKVKDMKNKEEAFFSLLQQSLELAKDTLLSSFELLTNKKCEEFPFLLGQNIWQDGRNVKETDRLRKLFKHGTLSIHFVGLEEALSLLTQEEDSLKKEKLGTKILEFMQEKVMSYCILHNLNFTLSAKKDDYICKEFNQIDTAIYGKNKGITTKDAYHNGFEKDVLSWKETLEIEAKYHSYTWGGHLSCFSLSKKDISQIKAILNDIEKEAIGAFYLEAKH